MEYIKWTIFRTKEVDGCTAADWTKPVCRVKARGRFDAFDIFTNSKYHVPPKDLEEFGIDPTEYWMEPNYDQSKLKKPMPYAKELPEKAEIFWSNDKEFLKNWFNYGYTVTKHERNATIKYIYEKGNEYSKRYVLNRQGRWVRQ